MRREQFAEAILRLVAGRERAAAIVGDFSEEGEGRSPAWFWWNVTRTAARLALRPVIASLAAFVVGIRFSMFYGHRIPVRVVISTDRQIAALILMTVLCGVWSLITYGWRDVAARYLAVLAAISALWVTLRRAPFLIMLLAAIVILFVSHRHGKTGRETRIIVASIVLAYAGYWAFRIGMPPVRLFRLLLRGHYLVIVGRTSLALQTLWFGTIVLISAIACSISHRIFSSDRREKLIA